MPFEDTAYPHVEMTEENKNKLVEAVVRSIASGGREQYEVARDGFTGVNNMDQYEFNREFCIYGADSF